MCGDDKPLSEYHPNKQCSGGVVGTCKPCSMIRVKKWYKDNQYRRQELKNVRNKEKKLKAIEFLGGKCLDCKNTYPSCAYDFHHISGEKEMNPSQAIAGSFEKAKEELKKCVLLCANCHRIRHFGEDTHYV